MPELAGKVTADIVTLRFPESGRLKTLTCHPGQIVAKGDLLAALDPQPVQTALDIELADYRRVRAEFDQLARQLPVAKTEDEKTKKEIAQTKLDTSVKSVEKYKQQLDSLTLFSPFDAVILSCDSLSPGVNVSPSGFPITLAALDSAVFATEVSEDTFYSLSPDQKAHLILKTGFFCDSRIVFLSPQSESNGFFTVHFSLPRMDLGNFRLGTSGKVSI